MTPSKRPPPKAALPTTKFFDPWNSSSSGHQRAENRLAGSVSWRESRSLKLGAQFSGGAGGGDRVSDTVGAGSEGFGGDGRVEGGEGVGKGRGQLSLGEVFAFGVRKGGVVRGEGGKDREVGEVRKVETERVEGRKVRDAETEVCKVGPEDITEKETENGTAKKEPQIFKGLCIYINGSTAPTISDHRLKHLLVIHGANISISLGRRSVTHVILGKANGSALQGAGGGLAASKIQKEIQRVGGNGVKFVTVEWVLESLKVGKRVQERRFEAVRLAQKGTGRLADMFAKSSAAAAAARKG